MSFGSKLKELRLKNKLTQEALAAKVFVSRQAVTKWEGSKGIPDDETVEKLAEIFNVSKSYFFEEDVVAPIKKKKSKLKVILISVIVALVLSIAYVFIHFTFIVPYIQNLEFENERRQNIVVASYLSYGSENLTKEEIISRNYPYLIKENNDILINKFSVKEEGYIYYVPSSIGNKLYYNELIFNEIKNEYRTISRNIDIYNFGFEFYNQYARVETKNPVREITIYSYDSRFDLIKIETFKRDNIGICNDSGVYLNKPYLDTYHVNGAFQYTLELKTTYDRKEIVTIIETKEILTFLLTDDWLTSSSSFKTKFII